MKKLYLIFLSFVLLSCSSNRKIEGTYKSNFAESGFFMTEIEFKNDSTFIYKFSGDLIHQQLTGNYKIDQQNVYLRFKKNKGEIESQNDVSVAKILSGNYHNYEIKNEDGIEFHIKFKRKNDKLFLYNIDNGELVTDSQYYSGAWKSKKIYLKRIY